MISKTIKIGLIGYGSVGKQLHSMLLENNYSEDQIYIFADDIALNEEKRIYGFDDYKREEHKDIHFIPTLGYLSKNLRFTILNYLIENNYTLFTFIHPSAFISKNAKIGKGVIIYPMCNIDQGAVIGDGAIILNSSIIAHDSYVGKCCYLAPGVCLSGFVKVGDLSFIGTAAMVANNITIGKNSTIAIGTCITRDIADNSSAIGNPFQLKKNININ